jgi:hypothetical protein
MARSYYGGHTGAPRPRLCEKSKEELLADVWRKLRRREGPFTDFSRAAIERLDEASPHWRVFADLLSRHAVSPHDTTSTRLAILRGLFLAGKHPTDILMEDEPTVAVAA